MLGQVMLELGVAHYSDSMKRHDILVRSKPVAFFDESHCGNAKTWISRTPLRYLPQKLWIAYEVRGPIETYGLFHLSHIAEVKPRCLQLASQAYVINIG